MMTHYSLDQHNNSHLTLVRYYKNNVVRIVLLLLLVITIQWTTPKSCSSFVLLTGVSGFSIIIGQQQLLPITKTRNIHKYNTNGQIQQQQQQQQQQQYRRNHDKLIKLYDVLSTNNNENINSNNKQYDDDIDTDDDDEYRIEQSDSLLLQNNNNANSNNNDDTIGGSHIPNDGYSVSDAITDSQKDRFVTTVVPIDGLPGVAQLVTSSTFYQESFEPVRYLVSVLPPSEGESSEAASESSKKTKQFYVLVDVPPYSKRLVQEIQNFVGSDGIILGMVVTNKDSIHYDDATGEMFSIRQNDIKYWKQQYPNMSIIGYRLDIPRNCRTMMTQILDGYGPFGMDLNNLIDDEKSSSKEQKQQQQKQQHPPLFIETGRPLTYEEWETNIANDIFSGNISPDYDTNNENDGRSTSETGDDNDLYTPEAIRQREIGKHILAVYTPGHTFGSVSYIFPYRGICCSGYVLPIEDNRVYDEDDEDQARVSNQGMGPILDCRGYVTTNQVGITRQMESARNLINNYIDRFHIVLPARGDPLFLEADNEDDDNGTNKSDATITRRKEVILQILSQYEKIGTIYEQLGIVTSSSSE